MTTQTHIKTVAQSGECNMELIMDLIGYSELEYKQHLFASGLAFLEVLFPSDTEFEIYGILHARQKLFWNWYRIQYTNADRAYLFYLGYHNETANASRYSELVNKFLHKDSRVQDGFNNYINTLKHYEKQMSKSR